MKILYLTNGIAGSGGLEKVLSIKTDFLVNKFQYDVTIISLDDSTIIPFYNFNTNVNLIKITY